MTPRDWRTEPLYRVQSGATPGAKGGGVSATAGTVHVFERAGLGRAPFRFVGISERRGPLEVAPGVFAGAPGQPMGTCAYCGTGIAECCKIRDADGKTFIVGNVCVGKTGDAGLRKAVSAAVRERNADKRRALADRKRAEAMRMLEDEGLCARLRALPHPYAKSGPYFAELTRMDWADWMLKRGGMKAWADVLRYLRGLEI